MTIDMLTQTGGEPEYHNCQSETSIFYKDARKLPNLTAEEKERYRKQSFILMLLF